MKNELKALYRKDKKLALEVAKVLGYKITTADEKKKALDMYHSSKQKLEAYLKSFQKRIKNLDNHVREEDEASYILSVARALKASLGYLEEALERIS